MPGHIFNINENEEQLDSQKSAVFHSVTQKLLYLMKRLRPDIETAVSFLMRRLSKSDNDDWKKLKRVLGFLKCMDNNKKKIRAKLLTKILSFTESAYAVHSDNTRRYMRGLVSIGIGIIHGKSAMQKINIKSTCESELVVTAEYLPYIIWIIIFMQAQKYKIKDSVIYQDNKSAILLERSRRNSFTRNS